MYGFDDLTGGLHLSHRLVLSSKDYPGILFEVAVNVFSNLMLWTLYKIFQYPWPVGLLKKIFKGNDLFMKHNQNETIWFYYIIM